MSDLVNVIPLVDVGDLVDLFKLLSDRTRLTILLLLANGERNVSSLCEQLVLPQPTVSHHLGLLRNSKIIANRRNGKQVFYGLNGRVDREQLSLIIDVHRFTVKIAKKCGGDIGTTDRAI